MVLNFIEICKQKLFVSHKGLYMAQYHNSSQFDSCFVVTHWTTTTIVAWTVGCC
jgi:hypothetical protein